MKPDSSALCSSIPSVAMLLPFVVVVDPPIRRELVRCRCVLPPRAPDGIAFISQRLLDANRLCFDRRGAVFQF